MSKVSLHSNGDRNNSLIDLLTVIGNEIPKEKLPELIILLRGHVDKDTLDYVENGSQLILTLYQRGLVTNKRLSFLRKFLRETKCTTSLSYLESYEAKNKNSPDVGRLEAASRRDERSRRLRNLTGRIENEILLTQENQENIKQDIDSLQNEIEKKKERIVEYEESMQKLKLSIKSEQALLQSVGKTLEDLKYVIKKLYREEESLNEKLNNNVKLKRAIRDELMSKRVEIKGKEMFEGELSRKYARITEQIRLLYTDMRHQTNEIIETEKNIQDGTCKLRILKKNLSKDVASAEELKDTLTELKGNIDSRLGFATPDTQRICLGNTPPRTSFAKMIDYDGLVERTEPLLIGTYGMDENPPQFIYPCATDIDVNDEIYVADSKNGRVQVLSLNGNPVRKPIDVGKTFQPSSVAVSSDLNVFISDSHVVRVYRSNGELLHYILPIYGNSDARPKITGLKTMSDGSILLVDAANKQLQKFCQDGTFQRFIGGKHVFQSPYGVTVSAQNDIIVSDAACQIKILDGRTESLKNTIGTRGIGKGKFLNPRGVTVDKDNNIIVADCESHQVHVLNTKDGVDSRFGSLGTDAGFFDTPCDVAVSSDGRKIIVVEARNHRVQILIRPQLDFE